MGESCYLCKGKGICGKPCRILNSLKNFQPKIKLEFSGSAPEVFIGRHNYPEVYTGILSPNEYGSTERFSMPELWFKEQATIEEIMQFRSQMIYSRFKSNIKTGSRFLHVMQEIALASRPVATEFKLKKKPAVNFSLDLHMPVVGNPAPLEKATLEENPKVERKVDYLTGDYDIKATGAIHELYKSSITVSNIIKILSAGLLGLKTQRKLVPSRWAITATDDSISKMLLEKVKAYPFISEFLLFHAEYLGNHYEILLMPSQFEFEVIEAKMPGSVWNPETGNTYFAQDYESCFGRKEYASNVTGAYYANRLAVAEYLARIGKQASCLVMREARQEYYMPCGVGILREASRDAFARLPEKFQSIQEALQEAGKRMRMPTSEFTSRSMLLRNFKSQKRLSEF
ncbi:hypothetical protein J4433_02845 [Candidatus Pacearchaeota archaeon]|nr:hypothetical protein [Candidatus Pacearchaeota archaeon]